MSNREFRLNLKKSDVFDTRMLQNWTTDSLFWSLVFDHAILENILAHPWGYTLLTP